MKENEKRPTPRRRDLFNNVAFTNLVILVLLALLYLIFLGIHSPGYSSKPYAIVTKALVLLGAGTLFFGLVDNICAAWLLFLVWRDHQKLIDEYGHPDALMSKIEDRSFWSSASLPEPAKLGAGLLYASLGRTLASGNLTSESFRSFFLDRFANTHLGMFFLGLSIRSATLLGLLGTVLGLKATFEKSALMDSGIVDIARILPWVGIALVTTMVGLVVALIGILSRDFILSLIDSESYELFLPVVNAVSGILEGKERMVAGRRGNPADATFPREWFSSEFKRFRMGVVLATFVLMAILLNIVCIKDGFFDKMLQLSRLPEHEITEMVIAEPTPTPERKSEFNTPFGELISKYLQALEQQEYSDYKFGFPQYRSLPKSIKNVLGESDRVSICGHEFEPLAGLAEIVEPFHLSHKLDAVFPRIVARLDLAINRYTDVPNGGIYTYMYLGRGGSGEIFQASPDEMDAFLSEHGFAKGYGLSRNQIHSLLSDEVIDTILRIAHDGWKALSYPKTSYLREPVWMLYDKIEKYDYLLNLMSDKKLEGRKGDFLVVYWRIPEDPEASAPEVRDIRMLSPMELCQELQRNRGGEPASCLVQLQ